MTLERFEEHTPRVAEGAYVHAAATVIGDVEIGERSSIWPTVVLRGDDGPIRIGAETSIQDGSVVHMTTGLSEVSIGKRVTVGHKVILHGCVVEDECLIGMGAIVLDNARIGRGSLVGAGALVLQNLVVPPGSLVLGSPAKVVRPVNEKEQAMIEQGWHEYVERAAQYLARDAEGS
ncbi:MAG: gamma carbonic anhydrase family protein [Planctomycetes bacterium]|nr:gamma carbonic anhydrase family protein [Planctomycetota bacterium]